MNLEPEYEALKANLRRAQLEYEGVVKKVRDEVILRPENQAALLAVLDKVEETAKKLKRKVQGDGPWNS